MKYLIICAAVVALFIFFQFCRARNRRGFLNNLKTHQTVRFGDAENIGEVLSIYPAYCDILDAEDMSIKRIMKYEIYPL